MTWRIVEIQFSGSFLYYDTMCLIKSIKHNII
nr:MAG TPA: hypothetical protein [Caudoviricetes sp.]